MKASIFLDYGRMNYLEPFTGQYLRKPEKMELQNIETDVSGSIAAAYNSIYENERTYKMDGLLSTGNVLRPGPCCIKVNFFYGK